MRDATGLPACRLCGVLAELDGAEWTDLLQRLAAHGWEPLAVPSRFVHSWGGVADTSRPSRAQVQRDPAPDLFASDAR